MVNEEGYDTINQPQTPILILSDGKAGHENQSVAFARLLNLPFEIRRVHPVSRMSKAASYLFDHFHVMSSRLFDVDGDIPPCRAVVSAGSETYYANRVVSQQLGVRSVAIMLPKGYRYAFDLIVAQQHDRPPKRDNILVLPVNLNCPEPKGLVATQNGRPCVSLIIGGPSRHFQMETHRIEQQLQQIISLFPQADFLATTSRRTPPDVEALIEKGPFRYKVIASKENTNPIGDFLAISDYVFVTEDSTSMISEAVSFGRANIEILPLKKRGKTSKIERMIEYLERENYVHLFNGFYGNSHRKFELKPALQRVWP